MEKFQDLYPQDFQKAWPHAYMLAVQQVATLQKRTGHQMASATYQVLLAHQTAEVTVKELRSAKFGIVTAIESATEAHLASVTQLSESLAHELARLREREKLFLSGVLKERKKIDQSRTQLEDEIDMFRNSPLWRRLWWALRPDSVSLLS